MVVWWDGDKGRVYLAVEGVGGVGFRVEWGRVRILWAVDNRAEENP